MLALLFDPVDVAIGGLATVGVALVVGVCCRRYAVRSFDAWYL